MVDFKAKMTIIESENRLMMKCIAGSRMYNLDTETSDTDIRGIYMPTMDEIFLNSYEEEISDDSQNMKIYSFPKFIELAKNCNPNIIELLFVPEDKILFKSKEWDELIEHRNLFISKKAKETFYGYSYSQIKKCKGNGKKANDIPNRMNNEGIAFAKSLINMEFTGKTRIPDAKLNRIKLQEKFGGNFLKYLDKCDIPFKHYENLTDEEKIKGMTCLNSMLPPQWSSFIYWYKYDNNGMPFRPISPDYSEKENFKKYDAAKVERSPDLYRIYCNGQGFINNNHIVLRPITKERERTDFLGIMKIDENAYMKEKKEYDSFWEWMANKNEQRYSQCWDKNKTCDTKNLMHCIRLLLCAENIAIVGIPKITFSKEERKFLLDIRNGKEDISNILKLAEEKKERLEHLFEMSPISEEVDEEKIRKVILDIYHSFAII